MILDTSRSFTKLDDKQDFVMQDGVIFAWSESNVQYERAWWLYDDAPDSPLAEELCRTRRLRGGKHFLVEREVPGSVKVVPAVENVSPPVSQESMAWAAISNQGTQWRGLFKLQEELNELGVELAKLCAFPSGQHPDGKGFLRDRIEKELADVEAAILYFREMSGLDTMSDRVTMKYMKFKAWRLSGV